MGFLQHQTTLSFFQNKHSPFFLRDSRTKSTSSTPPPHALFPHPLQIKMTDVRNQTNATSPWPLSPTSTLCLTTLVWVGVSACLVDYIAEPFLFGWDYWSSCLVSKPTLFGSFSFFRDEDPPFSVISILVVYLAFRKLLSGNIQHLEPGKPATLHHSGTSRSNFIIVKYLFQFRDWILLSVGSIAMSVHITNKLPVIFYLLCVSKWHALEITSPSVFTLPYLTFLRLAMVFKWGQIALSIISMQEWVTFVLKPIYYTTIVYLVELALPGYAVYDKFIVSIAKTSATMYCCGIGDEFCISGDMALGSDLLGRFLIAPLALIFGVSLIIRAGIAYSRLCESQALDSIYLIALKLHRAKFRSSLNKQSPIATRTRSRYTIDADIQEILSKEAL